MLWGCAGHTVCNCILQCSVCVCMCAHMLVYLYIDVLVCVCKCACMYVRVRVIGVKSVNLYVEMFSMGLEKL